MNSQTLIIVASVIVAIIVIAVAWTYSQRQRRVRLRKRFGPEYDRAVEAVVNYRTLFEDLLEVSDRDVRRRAS